jgi:hypothetical protein
MEEIGHPPPAPAWATVPTPDTTAPALQREFLHAPPRRFSILCRAVAVANDALVVSAPTIANVEGVP